MFFLYADLSSEPISVDPTFNLGQFYVTPITVRNQYLRNSEGSLACMTGPLLVHYKKTCFSYLQLFETIKRLMPGYQPQYIGTDGELELIKAIDTAFPHAIKLRCYGHIEKNVMQKCSSSQERVKAELKDAVETGCEDVIDEMIRRITASNATLGAYINTLRDIFHQCTHRGKLFFTNGSESINKKLKLFMKYKKQSLIDFLTSTNEFLICEEGKATDGYTGHSDKYCRTDAFLKTFKNIDAWHQLNKKEREAFILTTNNKAPEKSLPDVGITDMDFDVLPENAGLNIATDLLKSMYAKAERMINEKTILPAPSVGGTTSYSCLSSEHNKHYITTLYTSGEVKCFCRAFKVHHICSHCIASTHLQGSLFKFVKFHREKYKSKRANMEAFTRSVNPSRAGLKDHQRQRIRQAKNSLNDKPVTVPAAPSPPQCDHELENLVRLVNLSEHRRVRTCYGCKRPITENNIDENCLAHKLYRNYFDRVTGKVKSTFKREWAYFHVHCATAIPSLTEKTLHICPGRTFPDRTINHLKSDGLTCEI